MEKYNPVRRTTLRVVEKMADVRINHEKIRKLAENWLKRGIRVPRWSYDAHLKTGDERKMLTYLIILDSLNFCFWSPREKWHFTYKRKKYSGYFALSLALKDFFQKNPAKATFEYLSKIRFDEFSKILGGGKNLQFLKKRWEIARTVSAVFIKKYGGSPEDFVNSAAGKLSVLVPKIVKELPLFDDSVMFRGQKVYLWKRAQILAVDIFGALSGAGAGAFHDLEYSTAFADYKLPQILRFWGILEYSAKLSQKVDGRKILKAGSREEIEIRSATVWAVEYLRENLRKLGRNLYPYEIDWILWNKSQSVKIHSPHHLARTIFY